MAHTNCSQLLKSMGDYLDGDANPEICRQIEEHIQGCDHCRIVVDTLRKTISLYHDEAITEEMPTTMKQHLFKELNLLDYLSKDPGK
jgi:predicted anti-sigma-YlaC factor YlaD